MPTDEEILLERFALMKAEDKKTLLEIAAVFALRKLVLPLFRESLTTTQDKGDCSDEN